MSEFTQYISDIMQSKEQAKLIFHKFLLSLDLSC